MHEPSQWLAVAAEVRVPAATVQLVELDINDAPGVVIQERQTYWLDMSLMPQPRDARLCYRGRWLSQRFEPIGRMFVLPPGEEAQVRSSSGRRQASILCHLHPESIRNGSGRALHWTDRKLLAGLNIADSNIRQVLLRLANEVKHPGFAGEALVELLTAQLAIEVGRYFEHASVTPARCALTPWRLRLIEARLTEECKAPSLSELATLCRLSIRQLTRGFRAARGCSIGEYIASVRTDHAKRLLTGDRPVKAIAYSLGFSSPAAFCFAFRRATGLTPREFRTLDACRG
jgi:AraC family transcriptional regulator